MAFQMTVLGQQVLFEPPPHTCDENCTDPCTANGDVEATQKMIRNMMAEMERRVAQQLGIQLGNKNLCDPISNLLPFEISASIFELCLPRWKRTTELSLFEEDNASTLFTLGAVCKTWRHIIWSTPSFWSHLLILIDPSTVRSYTPLVEEWIVRSKDVPLSLAVYYGKGPDEPTGFEEWFPPLSKIINASSSRWECLDLSIPKCLRVFFAQLPSNLRELKIENTGPSGRTFENAFESQTTTGQSSFSAPTYVDIDYYISWESVPILWNNVTKVKIQGLTVVDCLELLRLAPKLESCTFPRGNPDNVAGHVPLPVVHAKLEELHINEPAPLNFVHALCDALTIPALENLTVQHNVFERLPTDNLLALMKRSSCSLKTAEIGCLLHEDDIITFLQATPSLRHLTFGENAPVGNFKARNFFKKLARTAHLGESDTESSSSQEIFLPHLESLAYFSSKPDDCESIWDVLPRIFGVPTDDYDYETEDLDPYRRPLKDVKILYEQYQEEPGLDSSLDDEPPTRTVPLLSKRTILKIDCVTRLGSVDLRILAHYKAHDHLEDLIEVSNLACDWDWDGDLEYTSSESSDDE
ncbi:hypothetical protein JR316_0001422 [Psilocybe cubensis]|uniref:F-box domain-containing protein n=2 Tax=Psilocybe cubensis TaxID=181762 RepID=A0A8H7YBT7_PSICU|nr:hypothetical protein JR316_0001422 [Psilocybe cubensis]KAH9487348.1 hypothetical protein JR316_0001422 [Psilocybe cubensis]